MTGKGLDYRISETYSDEISNIQNKLTEMKNGRVYEISNIPSDGYLATNVEQLSKLLNDLFRKIQNGDSSEINKLFID